MRIQLISDVHVEFDKDHGDQFIEGLDPEVSDVLVIAGDLGSAGTFSKALRDICLKYNPQPVVYVLGNHEYYGSTIESTLTKAQALADTIPNLHWLNRNAVEIQGRRFIGCTLWYPDTGARNWSDFHHIELLWKKLDGLSKGDNSFLQEEMREGDIVVTHMLPSEKCIAEQWMYSPDNIFFVHEQGRLIGERKPKRWCFGHTHNRMNVKLGETDLTSNPRGYPYEQNGFLINQVIEL